MCSACRQTKGAGTKRRHCHTRVADASRQLCDNADRLGASNSYRQWIQNKSMMMSATEKKSRVPMLMGKRCQSLGKTPRHKSTAQLDDDAGATRTRPADTGVTMSSAGDYDQKGNYLRGIRGKVPAFGREGASVAAVTASCNLARRLQLREALHKQAR